LKDLALCLAYLHAPYVPSLPCPISLHAHTPLPRLVHRVLGLRTYVAIMHARTHCHTTAGYGRHIDTPSFSPFGERFLVLHTTVFCHRYARHTLHTRVPAATIARCYLLDNTRRVLWLRSFFTRFVTHTYTLRIAVMPRRATPTKDRAQRASCVTCYARSASAGYLRFFGFATCLFGLTVTRVLHALDGLQFFLPAFCCCGAGHVIRHAAYATFPVTHTYDTATMRRSHTTA